jgi:hypothetical protein
MKIENSMRGLVVGFLWVLFGILAGCKKLITVPAPVTSLTSENVYSSDATAAAVLTGIYTELSTSSPINYASSVTSISVACGLSADELTLYGGSANANTALVQIYLNELLPGAPTNSGATMWNDFYSKVYTVNVTLERLSVSSGLTSLVRQRLMGEAKFLRAFFYFYLVNLYGDVPLTTTSDYRNNEALSRTAKAEVFQQIIADLKDSQQLLSEGYLAADAKSPTTERVRPNKWAATALLARAYLYAGNYDSAELEATAVINNISTYDTVSINDVFLKNSNEAIWQLQPVNSGWNTEDARVFILPGSGPTSNLSSSGYPIYLNYRMLNKFEGGDLRRTNWVDSVKVNGFTFYYPYKYKSATLNASVTEYLMVLRLGEQYLIRAEARANENDISNGQSDLNVIRTRAGLLPNNSANDKSSLLTAILHERQVELFTEWGHRWLDLKRSGTVDGVMNAVDSAKGTTWSPNWQWYPIPLYDITQDPNLIQNAGY